MILHVTHNDLDGIGCSILINNIYKYNVYTRYLNYDNVNDFVLNNYSFYDKIIITDLSISKYVVEQICNRVELMLFDHHKTAFISDKYKICKVENDKCATMIIYNYFMENNYDLSVYNDFVKVVNDLDMWIHNDPRSRELNRLFYLIGRDRFFNRFSNNPKVKFNNVEKFILKIENENISRYINKAIDNVYIFYDSEKRRCGIIPAEKYISEVGEALIKEYKLDYVIIIDHLNNKVSLRSNNDVDVSEIALKNGGGGHKNASGFYFNNEKFYNNFLQKCSIKK